jgi:hypothetical protein
MTIQGYNFVYNGKSSEEYGILLCKFDDTASSSNDEETEVNIVRTYGSDIFHLTNVDYTSPLRFQLIICRSDGSYIDSYQQREIKKWLCRTDGYHWLYIDQDDLNQIQYKCIITFNSMKDIGGQNGGMLFNVQCNAPYPYSLEQTKNYSCVSGTLSFNFYYDSDFLESDKMLYPNITITSATNGTIEIINNTIGESMKFTECVSGEIITISDNEILTTTANRNIIDYWNYNSLCFVDGINSISINGNCTIKLTYSCPRRVGG